jgi:hypothetical protein
MKCMSNRERDVFQYFINVAEKWNIPETLEEALERIPLHTEQMKDEAGFEFPSCLCGGIEFSKVDGGEMPLSEIFGKFANEKRCAVTRMVMSAFPVYRDGEGYLYIKMPTSNGISFFKSDREFFER